MTKIEVSKTELIWPGKYDDDGSPKDLPRVSLPFQVIETVNESRATREAKKGGVQGSLFDIYEGKEGDTFEAGWRNKLIWGDNVLVMGGRFWRSSAERSTSFTLTHLLQPGPISPFVPRSAMGQQQSSRSNH
jgi:hypothetical protein